MKHQSDEEKINKFFKILKSSTAFFPCTVRFLLDSMNKTLSYHQSYFSKTAYCKKCEHKFHYFLHNKIYLLDKHLSLVL